MQCERDVTRTWQRLFRDQTVSSDSFVIAESLLDDLPPESPLRVRLSTELEEIREMHQSRQTPTRKAKGTYLKSRST